MRFSFALAALIPLLPLVFAGPAFDSNPQYPCSDAETNVSVDMEFWPELQVPASYDLGGGIFRGTLNKNLGGHDTWFDLAINPANQAQIYIMNGKGKSLNWRVTYKDENNKIVHAFFVKANSPSCKSTMQVPVKDVRRVYIELERD
jgi:hypothetical protein